MGGNQVKYLRDFVIAKNHFLYPKRNQINSLCHNDKVNKSEMVNYKHTNTFYGYFPTDVTLKGSSVVSLWDDALELLYTRHSCDG